jgi:DNA (cytosine-5)-methyltransferase 1
MNILELFSGTCAFTVGLEKAGIKPTKVYYSEVNKHAIANTRYNHPEYIFLGDVQKITKANFPEGERIDLMPFGSPCQGFSKAGKNEGRKHEGSTLISEALRLVNELKPLKFIWENVEGVLTKTHREDFWAILKEMISIGEYTLEWQLCNTNWVLPQNRSRIFLVGHHRDQKRNKVFPIMGDGENPIKKSQQLLLSGKTIRKSSPEEIEAFYLKSCDKMPTYGHVNQFGDIDIYAGYEPEVTRTVQLSDIVQKEVGEKYTLSENQMNYLFAEQGKRFKKGFSRILNDDSQTGIALLESMYDNWTGNFVLEKQSKNIISIDLKQLKSKTAKGMIKDNVVGTLYDDCRVALIIGEIRTFDVDGETRWSIEVAPTIKSTWRPCGTNNLVLGTQIEGTNYYIRKLTEIECERLHGLKDDHTKFGIYDGQIKELPMTARYQLLGNGITADVAEMLYHKLFKTQTAQLAKAYMPLLKSA